MTNYTTLQPDHSGSAPETLGRDLFARGVGGGALRLSEGPQRPAESRGVLGPQEATQKPLGPGPWSREDVFSVSGVAAACSRCEATGTSNGGPCKICAGKGHWPLLSWDNNTGLSRRYEMIRKSQDPEMSLLGEHFYSKFSLDKHVPVPNTLVNKRGGFVDDTMLAVGLCIRSFDRRQQVPDTVEHQDISPKTIAKMLGVDHRTVKRAYDRLVERGDIEPVTPEDGSRSFSGAKFTGWNGAFDRDESGRIINYTKIPTLALQDPRLDPRLLRTYAIILSHTFWWRSKISTKSLGEPSDINRRQAVKRIESLKGLGMIDTHSPSGQTTTYYPVPLEYVYTHDFYGQPLPGSPRWGDVEFFVQDLDGSFSATQDPTEEPDGILLWTP